MQARTFDHPLFYLAIALGCLLLLAVDLVTRLGLAVWVLYLVPLMLCVLQPRPLVPLYVAGGQLALMAVGLLASPGGNMEQALANRIFGSLAIVASAVLAYQVLRERAASRRLLWLQQGQSELAASLLGEQRLDTVGHGVLATLAAYMNAQVGALYRLDHGEFARLGSYGLDEAALGAGGAGLLREAAAARLPLLVPDVPDEHVRMRSGTGSSRPRHLLVAPVTAEGEAVGAIELGFTRAGGDFANERELLRMVAEDIGMALRSIVYREHLKELLEETQRQSEELQTQQEELRVSNEELEEQGRVLRESQERLENQQSELEQTNVRLEEQAARLERQKHELLRAQRTLEINAEELRRANRYKSEFLANMSHELRTPLNSSLILAQILAAPTSAQLSREQIRSYAQTIQASNNDLLDLINDILDLSKIEAGRIDLNVEPVSLAGLVEPLRQMFEPVAAGKGVAFRVTVQPDAPGSLVTDGAKLAQVLKNLLSNAFKFTDGGGEVELSACAPAPGRVAFAVRDSGIGIAPEQQAAIFEAFRQADGTTSRKYGGTGLGLSISRELARLLGGEIRVQSEPGAGSVFTVEIAVELAAPGVHEVANGDAAAAGTAGGGAATPPATTAQGRGAGDEALFRTGGEAPRPAAQAHGGGAAGESADDDSGSGSGSGSAFDDRGRRMRPRLVLVIEDDERFAAILYELAHEQGFDCVHCPTADQALRLARALRPHGILLDENLPDASGLSVLERLKRDPATRHIPVHMISVNDHVQTALELGAVGYALKPVAREELVNAFARVEQQLLSRPRRVLVVEDDAELRSSIALLLRGDDVEITMAGTVAEALEQVAGRTFDCMVMDLMLPDASGYDLLEAMAGGEKYSFPPVIVYTGRALTRDEEHRLRRYSRSIIIKGAKSPERLLDEVTLFLHRVEASLPPDQRQLLAQARQRDAVFEGRRILVAEDDVRNVFALASILEPLGAQVVITRNGREALQALDEGGEVDLVLMDLMMPEMDGLAATREIRKRKALARLPVIALTAKAMPDDRRDCLEAGANDYIAKPIDVEKLVSLCRVWMPK